MATTTFGYNPVEDRVWMSCSIWQDERLWITRQCAQNIMQTVCEVLEQSAPGDPVVDAPKRATFEHDAAINRPTTSGPAMQTGRDTHQADAAFPVHYLLCTSAMVSAGSEDASLVFRTPEGERSILFNREGLHRWLRGLYLVLRHANWNLPQPPEWVTRSYLPPALRAILTQPAPDWTDDEEDDGENPPASS